MAQKQWDKLRISNEGSSGIFSSSSNQRPKFLVYTLDCTDLCLPVFETSSSNYDQYFWLSLCREDFMES